ncbi:MAG: hypothetical protein CM15mP21_7940 [Hyphomicrobiales bacterium]|nr:MAG: hypothetical protein CM15mP21_7940 [Hyphomicrobiales bacterium]
MSRIAYVDGVYQPIDMPGIHVEDRGYQFADGVYEVCAVHNTRLVDEDAHLDRLERSLAELGITAPMSRAAMKIVVRETLARNRIRNGIVYMQVDAGVASRDHNYPAGLKPVLVVTPATLTLRGAPRCARWYQCCHCAGSTLGALRYQVDFPAAQCAGAASAKEGGVQEAWQVNADGMVTEGAATNAWIVDSAGVLRTRPADAGILNGIVRRL